MPSALLLKVEPTNTNQSSSSHTTIINTSNSTGSAALLQSSSVPNGAAHSTGATMGSTMNHSVEVNPLTRHLNPSHTNACMTTNVVSHSINRANGATIAAAGNHQPYSHRHPLAVHYNYHSPTSAGNGNSSYNLHHPSGVPNNSNNNHNNSTGRHPSTSVGVSGKDEVNTNHHSHGHSSPAKTGNPLHSGVGVPPVVVAGTVSNRYLLPNPVGRPAVALSAHIMTLYHAINAKYHCERKLHQFEDEEGSLHFVRGLLIDNRYRVEEILGKGSFGTVFQCLDICLNQRVAVKVIRSGRHFEQQGRLESRMLQHLQTNPRLQNLVVTLVQEGNWRGHVVLVLELLSFNLFQLLRQTRFNGVSLDLVRKFTWQLLQVFLQLEQHDPPIVHCDLKPENVSLVTPDRSAIRVIDFGSAQLQTAVTTTLRHTSNALNSCEDPGSPSHPPSTPRHSAPHHPPSSSTHSSGLNAAAHGGAPVAEGRYGYAPHIHPAPGSAPMTSTHAPPTTTNSCPNTDHTTSNAVPYTTSSSSARGGGGGSYATGGIASDPPAQRRSRSPARVSDGGTALHRRNNPSTSNHHHHHSGGTAPPHPSVVWCPRYIQSRYYRSPEVILELGYTTAIDRWSLACMLVELHTGRPLFQGVNEADMLACFVEVLGPIPVYMIEASPRRQHFFTVETIRTPSTTTPGNTGGVSSATNRGGMSASRAEEEAGGLFVSSSSHTTTSCLGSPSTLHPHATPSRTHHHHHSSPSLQDALFPSVRRTRSPGQPVVREVRVYHLKQAAGSSVRKSHPSSRPPGAAPGSSATGTLTGAGPPHVSPNAPNSMSHSAAAAMAGVTAIHADVATTSLEEILGVTTGGPRGCRREQDGHDEEAYRTFLDCVARLLAYDPQRRMTCDEAVQHDFLVPFHHLNGSNSSTARGGVTTSSAKKNSSNNHHHSSSGSDPNNWSNNGNVRPAYSGGGGAEGGVVHPTTGGGIPV